MTVHKYRKAALCIVLVLACTVAAEPTRADDEGGKKASPFYTMGPSASIGTIYSFSRFSIEGRWAHGEQALWGGELIQGSAGSTVDVRLYSVGRMVVKDAGAARLAVRQTARDDASVHHLIASVINGEMSVQLQQDATAYIESGGSAFSSSPGATFVIRIREGSSTIDVARGTVDVETQQPQLRFTGRTVQSVGNRIIPVTGPAANTINTNTKSAKRIITRWSRSVTKTSSLTRAFSPRFVGFRSQATQTDEPAGNRRVQFETTIGSVTPVIARTDADGLANVDFNAGPNQGNGAITARILPEPGDPPNTVYEPYVWSVVVKEPGIWRMRNKLLLGAAAATLIIYHPWTGKEPIKQQPPPQIP